MSKKYKIIAKVEKEKFCKWNCDDLLSFVRFLDKNWHDWRWFNVYDNNKKSATYRQQIANYTRNSRPVGKIV